MRVKCIHRWRLASSWSVVCSVGAAVLAIVYKRICQFGK
jgi:hypothetical protein